MIITIINMVYFILYSSIMNISFFFNLKKFTLTDFMFVAPLSEYFTWIHGT